MLQLVTIVSRRFRSTPFGALAAGAELAWRAGRVWVVLLAIVTVISSSVPVAVAWLTKLTLDRIVEGDSVSTLIAIAVAIAVLSLLAAVLSHAGRYLRNELDRVAGLLAQDHLYAAVNRLAGLARFEDPAFLDRLRLAHLAGGRSPSEVVTGGLAILGGLVTIGGFLGSLFTLSSVMAAAVFASAIPSLAAQIALSRRRAATLWRLGPIERRELFYSRLMADDRAAKEIRLFGVGGFLHSRMLLERRQANAQRRRLDRRELIIQATLGALAAAIAGTGLVWAIVRARDGQLTVGDVSIFAAAVAAVQGGLAGLVGHIAYTHQQVMLFEHFQAIREATSDLPVRRSPTQISPLQHCIEVRDVWFRYDPEHPWTLRGINLTIPRGTTIGLVGRNGSGKSTLVKLLCRFYDPVRGSITWDGVDLREIDPAELRDRIGVVFQDFMHYDLTARENIGLGDLTALDDNRRIEEAGRQAGIHHDLAALPRGYETLLTRAFFDHADLTAGINLSGGQWQRIALARAKLRGNRDFLILDEPSSDLDAEAEYEIHARLAEHRRARTNLLISHRLGAVRDADVLAVLDQGHIVERGSHIELMDLCGLYAQLFTTQASYYRDDNR